MAAGSTTGGVTHAGDTEKAPAKRPAKGGATAAGDVTAGRAVFASNCSTCHGAAGTGGNGGPDLTSRPAAKQVSAVVKQVGNGGGGMPAFKGQLTSKEIADVAAYVSRKIAK